jgi:hypothetical protein
VTQRDGATTSAGEVAALGRGKEGDDASWTDVNLIGSKKIHTVDSTATNGW